MAISFAIR